jgi:hypothetical protein
MALCSDPTVLILDEPLAYVRKTWQVRPVTYSDVFSRFIVVAWIPYLEGTCFHFLELLERPEALWLRHIS